MPIGWTSIRVWSSDLIPFAGGADNEEEERTDLRSNSLQGEGMMQSSLVRDQSPQP